jgi:RimJ/RimL family protein N-acetyltransferase
MKYIHFRTGLRIVPFTEKHVNESYFSWFHDRETTRWNSHGLFPYGQEKLDAFLKEIKKEHSLVWAIEVPADAQCPYPESDIRFTHIGNVALQRLNWIYRSAELAIVIGDKNHRGKGHGFIACNMVMQHGWERLGLHRIWTGTAATNVAMCKTALKLGMKEEGTARDGMFLTGQYVDVKMFGALFSERIGWVQ